MGNSNILHLKEVFDAGTFNSNSGQAVGVTMNSLPQITSYQNLYSMYKIHKVKYHFIPRYAEAEPNQSLANSALAYGQFGLIRISTNVAKGPMNAPATELASLAQDAKIRMLGNRGFSVIVKNPVFGVDANPGGVSTETKWTTGKLGLLQSSDVIHNGLEWYAASAGSVNPSYIVFITVWATLYDQI